MEIKVYINYDGNLTLHLTLSLLERISTGLPGLDSLIEGGIPRGSTVMVAGNSGSGKTIM